MFGTIQDMFNTITMISGKKQVSLFSGGKSLKLSGGINLKKGLWALFSFVTAATRDYFID